VAYRAGLDDLQERKFLILQGLELRPLGRPARSQSLYRLRYPGSSVKPDIVLKISATYRDAHHTDRHTDVASQSQSAPLVRISVWLFGNRLKISRRSIFTIELPKYHSM
jgi:hypothetical protein